jgi:outer membrane protein assembly factor BamB
MAETYHRGRESWYMLDTDTGEIKEEHKDTSRQAIDEELVYNDLVLEKQGYGIPDAITARKKDDGSLVWQFDDLVVSNIAVGGEITYFLTKDAKLVAL